MDSNSDSRLAVYELQGKQVEAKMPARFGGEEVRGYVEDVYHDPVEQSLMIVIAKSRKNVFKLRLRTPDKVERVGDDAITLSWDDREDESDEKFFEGLREANQKARGAQTVFDEKGKGISMTFKILGES